MTWSMQSLKRIWEAGKLEGHLADLRTRHNNLLNDFNTMMWLNIIKYCLYFQFLNTYLSTLKVYWKVEVHEMYQHAKIIAQLFATQISDKSTSSFLKRPHSIYHFHPPKKEAFSMLMSISRNFPTLPLFYLQSSRKLFIDWYQKEVEALKWKIKIVKNGVMMIFPYSTTVGHTNTTLPT